MENTLNIKAAATKDLMQYSIFYSWLEQYYSRHQREEKKKSCSRTPTMLDLKGFFLKNKNIPFRSTPFAIKGMPESMRGKNTSVHKVIWRCVINRGGDAFVSLPLSVFCDF